MTVRAIHLGGMNRTDPDKRNEQPTKVCWIVDVTEHGRRLIFNRVDLPSDQSELLQHINQNLVGYCVRRSSPEDRDKVGEYFAVSDDGLILETHVNLTRFALTIEATRFM
jgi:hypothetical protein